MEGESNARTLTQRPTKVSSLTVTSRFQRPSGRKETIVRLGIEAPKEIPIRRKELRELTVAHDLFVEVAEVAQNEGHFGLATIGTPLR